MLKILDCISSILRTKPLKKSFDFKMLESLLKKIEESLDYFYLIQLYHYDICDFDERSTVYDILKIADYLVSEILESGECEEKHYIVNSDEFKHFHYLLENWNKSTLYIGQD